MSREYKDSGIEWIGDIPKEWEVTKMKHITELMQSGGTPTSSNASFYNENGIPWVAIGDMHHCGEIFDTNKHLTEDGLKEKSLVVFPQGTLLYSIYASVGKVSILRVPAAINQAILAISLNQKVKQGYGKYVLVSMERYVFSLANGNTQFNLNAGIVSNLNIPLPPLYEQQKIADYLDKVCGEADEMIALQEKMIEELKAYKQSVITEAVTKGLNPNVPMKDSGIDWIGEIPEHWEICRFKDIARVKANLVHPNDYYDYPQIAPDNIEKESGRLLPYKTVKEANVISDNHLFFKGQIIYSKIRPVLNKLIIAPFDGLCSADMYPIETTNNINYLKYYMLSEVFVSQVALVVQDRVKMPKINKNELGVIYVLSLPMDEQQQIASYLDSKCSDIDSLIAVKQQKIEELKSYKKSIIYEYVTGKKEVIC